MAATTTLLGLVTPTQGTLSGTWGDTVNYGISDYVDISVAGTLTLTNDGAVTLANTTGSSAGSNITSTLTGAGTVTAQFAIVRVTGTLTVAKVVTGPSYSKTYTVVNAATGGIVTFKASGQTGVSVAVGESAFVYFNGTDYVKVAGTAAVSSFSAGTTGLTPNTATTGAVTLAGTLATTNGGTGLTSFTSGGVVYASSASALATGSVLKFDGANLGLGVTPSAWRSTNPAFQIAQAGCLFGYSSSVITGLGSNTFITSGGDETYIVNGTATSYQQNNSGKHIWYNDPSGTAGNVISFTQAMTLDASGNLLVGTTSAASKLTVASEMSLVTDNNNRGIIGWDNSLKRLSFGTINASTAYFDSMSLKDGNLLVGATSTAGNVVEIYNNSNQGGRINMYKTTSGAFSAIANYYNGSYVGGVNYDNTSTSFPTSSDIRLKKNIVDASSASTKIDQIRIVSHGWKHDSAVVEFGVIAQELVNVAPQAVAVGDDGEEIETTWGVDYSKLVPLLIKAHQELKAEFDAYKASHP